MRDAVGRGSFARFDVPDLPSERLRGPLETLSVIRPHFGSLGITRVGLVTGLDTPGFPIGMAVRPNGRSLSVHQGKGLTDPAAMVSAAMEALEVAVSETVEAAAVPMTLAEADRNGLIDLNRLTRCRPARVPADRPLPFLTGWDLMTGERRLVPAQLCSTDHTAVPAGDPFDRSTDGLASGNSETEAIVHGLYELVERDAVALAAALPGALMSARRRPPERFASPVLTAMTERLADCGIALALFDVTMEFGLPVVVALVGPADAARRPDLRRAALCIGHACHHDAAGAAIRAILEACQARATAIAGARDDIGESWYRKVEGDTPSAGFALLDRPGPLVDPTFADDPGTPEARLGDLLERLAAQGMTGATVVPIACGIDGIHVRRTLVPGLEIGPGAGGRHIGPRLLATMLGRRR